MWIGAHVSTAGGLPLAIDRAREIGAEAIQIFVSPPQMWAFKPPPEEMCLRYRERVAELGMGPTWLHGIYLTNLATSDPDKLAKGVQSLIDYMTVAAAIGAEGVMFHTGSHHGSGLDECLDQVVGALKVVLDRSPEGPLLCLENSAGAGGSIGKNFQELGTILRAVGSPQLRVCLDTCHLFAAGYDVRTREALDRLFEAFDREVGAENLAVMHANDSKKPLGSRLDRHENIGEGHIGVEGFRAILNHPRFQSLAFLLEVPGYDNKGPDARNIATLKSLIAGRGAASTAAA